MVSKATLNEVGRHHVGKIVKIYSVARAQLDKNIGENHIEKQKFFCKH